MAGAIQRLAVRRLTWRPGGGVSVARSGWALKSRARSARRAGGSGR
jgi:hypothetical protein